MMKYKIIYTAKKAVIRLDVSSDISLLSQKAMQGL